MLNFKKSVSLYVLVHVLLHVFLIGVWWLVKVEYSASQETTLSILKQGALYTSFIYILMLVEIAKGKVAVSES